MDMHTANTHIQPFVWYRPKDFAAQEAVSIATARNWLNKLTYGGCLHCEKQGRNKLYITNQDRLI